MWACGWWPSETELGGHGGHGHATTYDQAWMTRGRIGRRRPRGSKGVKGLLRPRGHRRCARPARRPKAHRSNAEPRTRHGVVLANERRWETGRERQLPGREGRARTGLESAFGGASSHWVFPYLAVGLARSWCTHVTNPNLPHEVPLGTQPPTRAHVGGRWPP